MVGDPGPCPAFWALAKGRDEVIDVSTNHTILEFFSVYTTAIEVSNQINKMSKRSLQR